MARAGNGAAEPKAKGASKEKGGGLKDPPVDTVDGERKESEAVSVLRKRIRNLNKKIKKVEETEAAKASGASLNKDQVGCPCRYIRSQRLRVQASGVFTILCLLWRASVGIKSSTSECTNA
jgi:hypothetical protein